MEAGSSGFSAMAAPVFTGENYQVWAVKMTAFLEGHDLWEAVENDYEVAPLPDNPTMNQIKYHKERTTRKAKAKSCLYAAVSAPIFTRIMRCDSAKAIWDFLKTEYEGDEKIRSMKVLNLLREFERQQMKDSESVKEYSDRLIEIAEKIRVLGTDLKDERLVQKILVSLPEKFEATIASLENTRDIADIKLAELLSALQAQEHRRMMRREEHVEGALQAKVKFNDGGKGKKWNQSKGNARDSKFEAKEGSSSGSGNWKKNKKPCQHCGGINHLSFRCWRKPDAKCRRCHKFGHMEAICKEKNHQQAGEAQIAVNETKEEHLFVASCSGSSVVNDAWLVDSGCTNHMTGNLKLFRSLDRSVRSKVRIGNGQYIEVQGKGTVAIEGNQEVKLINDVLFVPKVDQNLLSVGQLIERGYKVKFEGKECLIDNADSKEVLRIPMKDKCFLFKPHEMQQMALKCKEENAELWHKRLGHVHRKNMLFMQRNSLADDLPSLEEEFPQCRTCLLGKQARLPFKGGGWRARDKLQLVHTDLCGPMSEPSLTGSRYFITFTDDMTRMSWIYFLQSKSEVADVFVKFKTLVENQSGKKIQMLRSDNGSEYTAHKFKLNCGQAGIVQ